MFKEKQLHIFLTRKKQTSCLGSTLNNNIKKKTRIAFLKTHKTGSSTFSSILNRFTDYQGTDVAIPRNDVRFNWPAPFSHQYVQLSRLRTGKADMLNLHSVLNYPELRKVMKSGFRLVTILREPVSQFRSMFYYLGLPKHYGLTNYTDPVAEFMKEPYKYHHFKPYLKVGREMYFEENLIRNGNLYDLDFAHFKKTGGGGRDGRIERGLKDFIKFLENAFHLVLITEKYDESLLLLKKLMCWQFMDIVYAKKHVNPNLQNNSSALTNQTAESIRAWNRDDRLLYQHFSKRLDRIISTQDQEQFNNDLYNFRKLNNLVLKYCLTMNNNSNNNNNNNNTESEANASSAEFHSVLGQLEEMGEKAPDGFMNRPDCFCLKMERNERDYMYFFAKRFPPFYFMKGMTRPQSTDDC